MDLSLRNPLNIYLDNLALLIAEKVHVGDPTSTNFNITGGSVTNIVGTLNQEVTPVAASTATRKSGAQTTPGLIPPLPPPPLRPHKKETLESKAPYPPQPPRPSSRAKRKAIPRHPETDTEPYDGEISSTPSPPRSTAAPPKRPPTQQPPPPLPAPSQPPSNPRKKARYTAPPLPPPPLPPPPPQSVRQKLLHLQDTVLRDIRYSLAEAHVLCAQLEKKIQEVVEDPLVVEGDYMLTVKDETERDETERDETEKDETERDETERDE